MPEWSSFQMREKSILEVGAGTGLASLIAARCGASRWVGNRWGRCHSGGGGGSWCPISSDGNVGTCPEMFLLHWITCLVTGKGFGGENEALEEKI